MAEIEEGVRARLTGHGGVAALVAARVYPLIIPEHVRRMPVVTYQQIDGERVHAMSADPGLVGVMFQVNAHAETYAEMKALAEQIRDALQFYSGTVGGVTIDHSQLTGETESFSPEGGEGEGTFMRSFTFTIWHRE